MYALIRFCVRVITGSKERTKKEGESHEKRCGPHYEQNCFIAHKIDLFSSSFTTAKYYFPIPKLLLSGIKSLLTKGNP